MRYNHSLRRLVFLFTKVSHSSISWVFHAFSLFEKLLHCNFAMYQTMMCAICYAIGGNKGDDQ